MIMRYQGLLVGLTALVVVLAGALIWSLTRPASAPPPAPAPTSSTSPDQPTFNPSAGDAGSDEQPHDDGAQDRDANQAAWQPVVEHFGRNFTNTAGGDRAWRDRLAGNRTPPYITDDVAQQLTTVDVRNVPKGHYKSFTVAQSSDYQVAVKVIYREGWAIVLHLITDGTAWQVYSYDRWQQ